MYFSQLWRPEVRLGCQHGGVLVRDFLWVADCGLFILSSQAEKKARELPGERGLFYKGINPIHEDSSHMT